jgi:integrase
MGTAHSRTGEFRKVGENFYRYSSSGVYYARFRNNGKLIHRSLRTTDRDLGKRRLQEEIDKLGKIDTKLSKMTLSGLLDIYEQSLNAYAGKTIATRKSILKIFKATWTNGLDAALRDVNTAHLELWLGGRRANLKNASYNEYARFVRNLFELAVKLRVLAESPARAIKGLKVETPIRLTPTWEQFHQIVQSTRAQQLSADARHSGDLLEFMGLAGVGTAECANLRGEHIDLSNNRITLYRQKTDTGYSIPIFPQLLPFLKNLDSKGCIVSGEPLFKIRDPKKSLAAACKRLGYQNFSPRSLRRCFITRAIELGVDFKTIASWQGHRDGGVLIAKTYSHLRNEHSDNMARKLVGP